MNHNVLIVEDEELLAETLQQLFELNGFKAEYAVDGNIAKQILNNKRFDLILSDMRMPILDGTELLKVVNELNRTRTSETPTKVIIMSGYSDHSDNQLKELGATEVILKPIDFSQLLSLTKKILMS